ncbi:metalloregulator ArsR/SmtB family transcription factor [Microbacterium sp. X-17]|uniref:metalloregulator ArsR/SmtB family transcription factor n=1 Tax=Microbacterium sp. X-17 TaxID=3144404 RepID=UPI0031F546BA
MDIQQALAAIGEPTRYRIVRLLAASPLTVGEVAAALGALQPQTTKHLQALEAAGLVRIHALGRRRVVRLDRTGLETLAGALTGIAASLPDEEADALERYEHGIAAAAAALGAAAAEAAAGADRRGVLRSTVELSRTLAAPPERVWVAFTDPGIAALWWAPPHFEVVSCAASGTPGDPVRLVLREGDGAEYTSEGRVVAADPGRTLVWEQAPLDGGGAPLFDTTLTLALSPATREAGRTRLELRIDAAAARADAAPALAGLQPGWDALLDGLERLVQAGEV